MSSSSAQFGRVPSRVIAGGGLIPISRKPAALAVYIAYLAHADKTWHAYLGETRIIKLTALDADSVRRGRRALEDAKLIVDTGRTKHRCKVYLIAQQPPQPCGVSPGQSPAAVRGVVDDDPPQDKGRPPAAVRFIPRTGAPQTEQNRVKEQREGISSGNDAAAMLSRLAALNYSTPVERIRLVTQHPDAIAAALIDLDERIAGGKVRNPAGLLAKILGDTIAPATRKPRTFAEGKAALLGGARP